MTGLGAIGLLTGWGEGLAALPPDAARAAGARPVVPLPAPAPPAERFRRATRECLLAVAAVQAALREAGLGRPALAGRRTALLYVTAAAYGAANRHFIEGPPGGALHFPYTAPSAVPAEVSIEFALTGPYAILIGGPETTRTALEYGARLLAAAAVERVLVLAVETFVECADLWARARWRCPRPLTEAAACALLGRGGVPLPGPDELVRLEARARRRAGETLACGPLVALALHAAAATATAPGGGAAATGGLAGGRVAWS